MKKDKYNYVKVAYLGIPGSFSFLAAQNFFKEKINMIASKSISEVFKKVTTDSCNFGVVPLENSTTGSIMETYDLLRATSLSIVGEVILKIHHHLLGQKGSELQKIRRCFSHPQAISQCESFLAEHPWIKPVFASDTATAARSVVQRRKDNEGVIAGREVAKMYRLSLLCENIESNKNNFTRFSVIGKKKNRAGDKISLAFSVRHVPGSLFRALRPYAKAHLNLTKIESRPIYDKPWEYIFFLDFEIGNKVKKAEQVIMAMKEEVLLLNVLGRYQKGKTYET